ncbi:MAG: ester cyclase, partial [Candidatus Binatia bacterium]
HGHRAGREGMERIYQSLYLAFPDYHWDLQLLLAEEEWVTAQIMMTGTHLGTPVLPVFGGLLHVAAPTGKHVAVENIHIYRVDNRLIAEHSAVRDDLGMMQQLGLLQKTSHGAGDMSRPAISLNEPERKERNE